VQDRPRTHFLCPIWMISRCSAARDRTRNRSEWSSETRTDATSGGYRRRPVTSIDATRTVFQIATGNETLGGSMLVVLLPTHPLGVAGGAAPFHDDMRRLDGLLEPHATLGSAMGTLRGDTKDDGGFLHVALSKQRGLMKLLGQTRIGRAGSGSQLRERKCGAGERNNQP
jgi:hypothetical protein